MASWEGPCSCSMYSKFLRRLDEIVLVDDKAGVRGDDADDREEGRVARAADVSLWVVEVDEPVTVRKAVVLAAGGDESAVRKEDDTLARGEAEAAPRGESEAAPRGESEWEALGNVEAPDTGDETV